ncbi:MAG: hypothetical protein ACOCP8_03175 [archaeon]
MSAEYYEQFKSDYKKRINRRITTDVKTIILYGCGLAKNVNYTMYSTIEELINQEYTSNSEKLKLYISALDNIKELLNLKYPYINFDNINLSWTVKEIIDGIKEINQNKIPTIEITK